VGVVGGGSCGNRRGEQRALAILVVVAAFLLWPSTRSDAAGTLRTGDVIASYATPGCPGAAIWHIGYRLYWRDDQGRTTSKSALPATLDELKKFVDGVGDDSACGVRLVVDVYDEGDAPWPVSTQSNTLPSDNQAFLSQTAVDWIFYRFPSSGESYCANTNNTRTPNAARFPVAPNGKLGCVGADGVDCMCEPWSVLMEHEWLHAVVAFYEPRLGWPTPDVHGSLEHGYARANTDRGYFADMMKGKVPENGTLKGIQPDEWAKQGTPAKPLIKPFTFEFAAVPGTLDQILDFPADPGAPVHLTVRDSDLAIVSETAVTTPGFRFSLPGFGLWRLCVSFEGSSSYRKLATAACTTEAVYLHPPKIVSATRRAGTVRVIVTGTESMGEIVLSAAKGANRLEFRRKSSAGQSTFVLRLGKGTWTLRARVEAFGAVEAGRPVRIVVKK
jgi:hypothetical protein